MKSLIANKLTKAKSDGQLTIAFIGGSITQGSSAGSEKCYAALTYRWFKETFPSADITYINAGIGATGSYIGVHRVEDDVLRHHPDIVFVEFSVNDIGDEKNHNRNIAAYDSLLWKIKHSINNPAIIAIAMTKEDGESFEEYHLEVAKHYQVPMISYRTAILAAIKEGHFKWSDISDDDIHPNEAGHEFLAELNIDFLKTVSLQEGEDCSSFQPDIAPCEKNHTTDKYKHTTCLWARNGSTPISVPATTNTIVPTPCGSHVYAALIPSDGYTKSDEIFCNIAGFWRVTSRITFAVKARNIGIFFGKLTDSSGSFRVFVDGFEVADFSFAFPGGWGDCIVGEEVYSSDIAMRHIVEIVANVGQVIIVGLAVS